MLQYKKISIILIVLTFAVFGIYCNNSKSAVSKKIIGWNILSSNKENAYRVIDKAKNYNVNHLQLSHNIIHNLKEIKNTSKKDLVNELITYAHQNGIDEVVIWDHALYDLEYYPEKFKSAKGGKLNLDDPNFWNWIKEDYRNSLKLIPDVNGIVLTFIETGARIEDQYSNKLKSSAEKQAALVDSLASVIIDELHLSLYIRTFAYNKEELTSILKCLQLIKNHDIVVMCKETPHDFFVTHPISQWVQNINLPVIIEFDCTHEFSGQSVVASIFPEIHFNRWEYYKSLPNVIGFSIRTDRYGTTTIIDRPSEINLFAIHALNKNPHINMETVYDNFIIQKYGKKVLAPVKSILKNAPDIIESVYYTLGLNTANHSKLDFDYRSIYTRHVSGRWMDNPSISINHGVNKEFQYWIDIVNHLSPLKHKLADKKNMAEIGDIIEHKWIQPKELMNEEYLSYVITEKEYGLKLAREILIELPQIKKDFKDEDAYNDLFNTFERTELSSKLFLGVAKAYYGNRIYNRGDAYRSPFVIKTIIEGLDQIQTISNEIKKYEKDYPIGQYDWKKDADIAIKLYDKISKGDFKKYLTNHE